MSDHPINSLMNTAMQSIKEMVDVNTIVGDPVETQDGIVIIPISKVTFGLAAGGGEYSGNLDFSESIQMGENNGKYVTPVKYPFAGGSGAGVSITPVAFMVVGSGKVQLLPIDSNSVVQKLVDLIPDVMNKVSNMLKNKTDDKTNQTNQCADKSITY